MGAEPGAEGADLARLQTANAEFEVRLADGATIAVTSFGKGKRIVGSHGNGFAVGAYRDFWTILAERYEVVLFDQRHHGRSSPYTGPVRNIPQFIDDLELVLRAIEVRLGAAPVFGAFHSLSALVALLHASTRASPWSGLVAFEPPVPAPPGTDLARRLQVANHLRAEAASRRRAVFEDAEALAASFARHGAFSRMSPDARLRLAAATLRPRPSGGFELRCAREFEAETFRLRFTEGAWASIAGLTVPLCLVGSDPAQDGDTSLPEIAAALAHEGGFAFRSVPGTTHFLQLEEPAACARIVDEFVASVEVHPAGDRQPGSPFLFGAW